MNDGILERYVRAVSAFVPAPRRETAVEELRTVLSAQRVAKQNALGRPLTAKEEEELVQATGSPLAVAARYWTRRYAVGPDLYPYYVFAVGSVLLIVSTIAVVACIFNLVFGSAAPEIVVLRAIGALFSATLFTVGTLTVVFWVLERYLPGVNLSNSWRPTMLPHARPRQSPTWQSIASLTAGSMFTFWWLGWLNLPSPVLRSVSDHLMLTAAPIWDSLYWPIACTAALALCEHAIALVYPGRWRIRMVTSSVSSVGAVTVIVLLYGAGQWVNITDATWASDRVAATNAAANLGIRIALIVAAAAVLLRQILLVRGSVRAEPMERSATQPG